MENATVQHFKANELMEKIRVLIGAYACGPYQGSEPSVGWNWILRVSSQFSAHQFVVLVEELEFRKNIENFLSKNTLENVEFVYVKRIRWRYLEKLGFLGFYFGYYLTYAFWQYKAYKVGCKLHDIQPFQIVHHLNMIGFREPGFLYRIKDVRYIHGPVGGGGYLTKEELVLFDDFRLRFRFSVYNVLNYLQSKINYRWNRAAKRADFLFFANKVNQGFFNQFVGGLYIAADDSEVGDEIRIVGDRSICWIGRFLDTKHLGLFLEIVNHKDFLNEIDNVHIIGDFDSDRGDSFAIPKKLDSKIIFHGWIPKLGVKKLLESSRVMCMTSVREGTPVSIIEAYGSKCAVVALRTGGVEDMLPSACLIDIVSREQIVHDFRKKVIEMLDVETIHLPSVLHNSYRQDVIHTCYGY